MAKAPKKPKEDKEIPQMPFDDALRRMLSAPPNPKVTAKKKVGKKK